MLITVEIEALLSRQANFQGTEPVEAGVIRRFDKALGLEDPGYDGLADDHPIAPPIFVFSVNHDSPREMNESGRPAIRVGKWAKNQESLLLVEGTATHTRDG